MFLFLIPAGEIENTEMLQGLSGGSARTDSYSNRMLSDRARRRRKLLRERAHLSNGGTHCFYYNLSDFLFPKFS